MIHASPIVAAGLHAIVANEPGLSRVDRDDRVSDHAVVIADLEGVRGLRHRSRSSPPIHAPNIVLVSEHLLGDDVRRAMALGIRGYVAMDAQPADVVRALRTVGRGGHYFPTSPMPRSAAIQRPALTPREQDVLALVGLGMTNKAMALSLGIGPGTIKAHMQSLLGKLGASCRTEALAIALRRGLVAGHARTTVPASVRDHGGMDAWGVRVG